MPDLDYFICFVSATYFKMAEADENRTHLGRDTPHIGFEDRECHQSTCCLRDSKRSGADDPPGVQLGFGNLKHIGDPADL